MIKTNLATRPFYNTRAVSLWLGVLGAIVVAATLFNIARIVTYSRSDSVLGGQADQDVEQATAMRGEAAALRASVNAREVDLISSEAQAANDLIDRRVFSWTELFNQFEQTLPPNVRITAVRPKVERDRRVLLTVNVVARGVDDVNQFMESLEKTGAFTNLLSREEHVTDDGQLEATLESTYGPASAQAATGSSLPPSEPATASGSAPVVGAPVAAPSPTTTPASPVPPGGRP